MTQNVGFGSTVTYALPTASDPEASTVTMTAVQNGAPSLPSFITFSGGVFTIVGNSIGTYIIDVTLSDGVNTPVSSFSIIVSSTSPPTFVSPLVTQNILLGNTVTYALPSTSDPASLPVTLSAVATGTSALPAFVTLSGSTFTIGPNLASQVG